MERIWRSLDSRAVAWSSSYPTGSRPFPGAATSDGRLAFAPGYADGTVTIIDLFKDRVLTSVDVGVQPSGGSVMSGDIEYASVIRGDDKIVFINTASHLNTGELSDGIGSSPFSLVVTPNGRLAFVNNTTSHDISVIDVAERRVIQRVSVPDVPIVMAVHPSGGGLWLSSEGGHGHDSFDPLHERTLGYSRGRTIRQAFAPDVVCTEIAPDRWERTDVDLVNMVPFLPN